MDKSKQPPIEIVCRVIWVLLAVIFLASAGIAGVEAIIEVVGKNG